MPLGRAAILAGASASPLRPRTHMFLIRVRRGFRPTSLNSIPLPLSLGLLRCTSTCVYRCPPLHPIPIVVPNVFPTHGTIQYSSLTPSDTTVNKLVRPTTQSLISQPTLPHIPTSPGITCYPALSTTLHYPEHPCHYSYIHSRKGSLVHCGLPA